MSKNYSNNKNRRGGSFKKSKGRQNNDNTPTLTGFAPYNFMPFYDGTVPARFNDAEEPIPRFNASSEKLVSGRIEYDFRVLTDMFVGSEFDKDKTNNDKTHFFNRDQEGRLSVPGSTMRGFIRSNAELLSFSMPEFITDEKYLFRKFAAKGISARNEYSKVIKIKNAGSPYEKTPEGVKAGWIHNDGEKYYIKPVKDFPGTMINYIRVPESQIREAQDNGFIHLDRNNFMYNDKAMKVKNDYYKPYRSTEIVYFTYRNKKAVFTDSRTGGAFDGILLNSAAMNKKTHHFLVSYQESDTRRIDISPEEAANYKNDYERNSVQNKKLYEDFYALPDEGKKKLFFYKIDENGKLFGFGPTPFFRIPYNHSVHEGLPMTDLHEGEYDYTRAMFGFIGAAKSSKINSFKSRISFQDAVLQEEKPQMEERKLPLLGPHGTAYDMYLVQDGRSLSGKGENGLLTYNSDSFTLRGHKFYWKRSKAVKEYGQELKNKDSIFSIIEVLPAGDGDHVFKGKIYFENLYEDELGLLLKSMQFKNADDHSVHETYLLGGAKPYGYGKIEFENIRLFEITDEDRFTQVSPEAKEVSSDIDRLKNLYCIKMDALLEKQSGSTRRGEKEWKTFETEPSVRIYEKYIQKDNMDAYLNQYPFVYMPIDGDKDKPRYSKCDPLPSAREIFRTFGGDSAVTKAMTKGTVCKFTEKWKQGDHHFLFAKREGRVEKIYCSVDNYVGDKSRIDRVKEGDDIYMTIERGGQSGFRAREWTLED